MFVVVKSTESSRVDTRSALLGLLILLTLLLPLLKIKGRKGEHIPKHKDTMKSLVTKDNTIIGFFC